MNAFGIGCVTRGKSVSGMIINLVWIHTLYVRLLYFFKNPAPPIFFTPFTE